MKKYFFTALSLALFTIGFTASDYNQLFPDDEKTDKTDIPADKLAEASPTWTDADNAIIPNIQSTMVTENGTAVFRIDMTGIQNKTTLEWLRLLGTGEADQNVWVEIDGMPKGIKVYNTADGENNRQVPVDLVFLVDNSGSMSEEANAIARDIDAWASKLNASGLDIRFGCVGYDGDITGAINITSSDELSTWLNREYHSGTNRTVGFAENAADLSSKVDDYRTGGGSWNECGMAALRFADENFSFRKGANRIYVNFTDEPNQNNNIDKFSVESLKTDWTAAQGTIHTVFSDGSERYQEYNYLMSQYTGGTVINCDPSFLNVTLESLPVSDAMRNSYIIRLANMKDLIDGKPHTVTITVYDNNGEVKAKREFTITFSDL